MMLEGFITAKKAELDLFLRWYKASHQENPDHFPLNESPGYWEEQALMFDPDWASEDPGPGGPGQDECCDCGADLREATVTYGAGDGSGTGRDGFFRCENCHKTRGASNG
jgi:hypothetical protein